MTLKAVDSTTEIPTYASYVESDLIDEDVKEFFKGKSYMTECVLLLQLIKSIKELIKVLKKV